MHLLYIYTPTFRASISAASTDGILIICVWLDAENP